MSTDTSEQMCGPRASVVLTGATGFLGREILWKLMAELPVEQEIVCLVRGKSQAAAEGRLAELLAESSTMAADDPRRQRVRALVGDISRPQIGLSATVFGELAAQTVAIYHGAATVRFDLPLHEARQTNVDGTRVLLELATAALHAGRLQRFHYIGTAFVAGNRRGLVLESELRCGQSFNNTYEETKCEAEELVRGAMAAGLPVTIYRPSIVVGDSKSGYTSSFKVMYWPLKIFSRGLIPIVPASRASIVDLIPVDFVVDAIWLLGSRADSLGRCYHLVAGPEQATTIGDAMDAAADYFHVYKPLFVPVKTFERYVRPVLNLVMRGKRRRALDSGRVYVPYLNYRASFDTSSVRRDLRPSGLSAPNVRDYFQTLLRYCVESDWGRKKL
jgi:long-chain acyl-CoA synthetase